MVAQPHGRRCPALSAAGARQAKKLARAQKQMGEMGLPLTDGSSLPTVGSLSKGPYGTGRIRGLSAECRARARARARPRGVGARAAGGATQVASACGGGGAGARPPHARRGRRRAGACLCVIVQVRAMACASVPAAAALSRAQVSGRPGRTGVAAAAQDPCLACRHMGALWALSAVHVTWLKAWVCAGASAVVGAALAWQRKFAGTGLLWPVQSSILSLPAVRGV